MRTARTILMAGIMALAGLVSTGASADDFYLVFEADRLYAASIRFSSEIRHHHHERSYWDRADRFSREAARFRRAVHERRDHRRLVARYNELVRDFDRLEREFRRHDYRGDYRRDYRRDYYTHDNRYFGRDQRFERKHRSKDRRYEPPRKQRYEREQRRNHYRD